MHVTVLSVTDFRSYQTAEVDLGPGVTAFVGSNGQGKTNLVEALVYLATLSSHRVATDAPLVRAGAERAVVRAEVARGARRLLLEIEINPGRANRARINRSPVPRPRELLGGLRTVLFAPEDLALVKGDPAERRRFLDDLLVSRAPRFAGVRADYERVVRQRNALLKSAGPARRAGSSAEARDGVERTLEVWDAHLVGLGAELLAARIALLADLAPHVGGAYTSVAPSGGAAIMGYVAPWSTEGGLPPDRELLEEALRQALERRRRDELDRGVTLVGPHRDDVLLSLGDLPARGYASHGESWSFALALRLASYDLLRADTDADGEPVLVLDDVFAELDADRRDRLASLVRGAEQVLVTAAVPADIPVELSGVRYDVNAGSVSRAG